MRRRLLVLAPTLALAACMQPGAPARSTAVVFFTADSASLDPGAQAAIEQMAAAVRADSMALAHVRGFAASDTGTAAFNKSLAQTRAQRVADALVAAGVAQSRIRIESRGAVPFDLMPTEARRVEIVVDG